MNADINKVVLIGKVASVPERGKSENGLYMVNFSMTTEKKILGLNPLAPLVEWHRIVAYGDISKTIKQNLHKGVRVYLKGHLQTRKWTDSVGMIRHGTDIVLDKFVRLDEDVVKAKGNKNQHYDAGKRGLKTCRQAS